MLLAAVGCGLGTLWICDILDVYDDIRCCVGRQEEIVAAVAVGYPRKRPAAKPRRPMKETASWAI
jgi:nitroreductase